MKKDMLYLVHTRERLGFTSGVRHDLAYRYNMPADEAIKTMNYLNSKCTSETYRYTMQKQRTKFQECMGNIISGLTAEPIEKYSDQFRPPYTGPFNWG